MSRYKTIPNKIVRDTARKLDITVRELEDYMEQGQSVLDNEQILSSVLSATGLTRGEMEKDSFESVIHFIKNEKGYYTKEIPSTLQKKWEDPIG